MNIILIILFVNTRTIVNEFNIAFHIEVFISKCQLVSQEMIEQILSLPYPSCELHIL